MRLLWFGLLALVACDPVASIQGNVRSQGDAGPAEPLAGAEVSLVCEKTGRRQVLARTRKNGGFYYATVGEWPEDCVIEVATRDGSHAMARQQMAALCANAVGGFANQCLRIEAASFVLKRKHERRSVKVAFRPDDEQLQLRSDVAATEPWCDGRCDVETPPVPQRLSVFDPRTTRELWSEEVTLQRDQRMQVTFSPDPDPEWPSTLGAVFNALGVGGLVTALATENWEWAAAGGISFGIGTTLMLVWAPGDDSASVKWMPLKR